MRMPAKGRFAVLLGSISLAGLLLLVNALIGRPAPATPQVQPQPLTKLEYMLSALDDLEKRSVLPPEITNLEKRRYAVEVQAMLDESTIQTLLELKQTLATLEDLQARGFISQEILESQRLYYLKKAQRAIGVSLEPDHMMVLLTHLEAPPSATQASLLQDSQPSSSVLAKAVWLFSIVLLVTVGGWFLYPYVASIWKHAPAQPQLWKRVPYNGEQIEPGTTFPIGSVFSLPTVRQAAANHHANGSFARQSELQPEQIEPLTRRELEVLRLIAEGLSNQEIARKLMITNGTVKIHVSHIYDKLGVSKRTQAVAKARAFGILPDA